jgi:hypothetical protein
MNNTAGSGNLLPIRSIAARARRLNRVSCAIDGAIDDISRKTRDQSTFGGAAIQSAPANRRCCHYFGNNPTALPITRSITRFGAVDRQLLTEILRSHFKQGRVSPAKA